MAKAIAGAALIAGGIALDIYAPYLQPLANAMISSGISMEAGAIADALMQNRGTGITTRQPAAFRQIIYGEQRVGGIMVYESTTGNSHDQYNMVIVVATHVINGFVNLYLDGRQVHWKTTGTESAYNVTRNGLNFGGDATDQDYIGPGGQHYNFADRVFADARFGDQVAGDVMQSLTANDPNWTSNAQGSPYLGGNAYIYLKVEYDQSLFPSWPEVRITVQGKSNIYDPRLTNTVNHIAGSITSGTFVSDEQIVQSSTGATAYISQIPPTSGPLVTGVVTGTPDATHTWKGQFSGAVFTPTGLPQPVASPTPNVLSRPTTTLNGWGGNVQQGPYEEGQNQAVNWGYNSGSTLAFQNPGNAVDGNLATYAIASYQHTHQYAGCIWTFPTRTGAAPASLWLNVNSSVNPFSFTGRSAGIWFTVDGGTTWTQLYNTISQSQQWNSVELAANQDWSLVKVMAFVDAHDDMAQQVFDVQLADAQQANGDPGVGVYTYNWALVVADVIQNADNWGLGDIGSVNVDQLIAAANVCDEQVPLAAGGTESKWACHWHYDTGTSPGDVLQTMMPAAAGRLSRIGGEWYVWPAYWQAPTFTWDESIIAGGTSGGVVWKPYRKFRDKFNRVTGTYIAPNYPYNVAGNFYDTNGWYYGTIQNNFPFAFQPTNYPMYAMDAQHGYVADVWLSEDNDIQIPKDIVQNCVLSVSQAQRAAKVLLLRNRNQGTGEFEMKLAAWQMQPLDVMQLNFPPRNWVNKMLEVSGTRFEIVANNNAEAPTIKFTVSVQSTDASVYEWTTTEELGPYDTPYNPQVGSPYTVPPITGLTLTNQPVTQSNGLQSPQIAAAWQAAPDVTVTQYNVQYQQSGATSWTSLPPVTGGLTNALISSGLVGGNTYTVQVQAQRQNGAVSAWVQATITVTNTSYDLLTDGVSGLVLAAGDVIYVIGA